MDKRKLYVILAIGVVALLPAAVFASVVIDQSYAISATQANNPVLMTQGPNYKTANSLGFITLTNGTDKGQVNTSTNTITVGTVANDTSIELLNVLEINTSSSSTVTVTLTVSSTSGITVYYATYVASASSPGKALTTSPSGAISLTPTTPIYLSIELTGSVTSPVTLTTTYTIS